MEPARSAPRRDRPRRLDPMPSPVTGRVSPSAAAIARPLLVLLPVLTFLIPSLFIAFTRTPEHTAEARLLVGGFDVQAQAVPGFVEAARTLASTYARLVSTPAIIDPVAKKLKVDPGDVSGHISATSVPESSIIRVEGDADNAQDAVRFADAAATALKNYAGGSRGAATDVLKEFQNASRANASAQSNLDRINRAVQASADPPPALREQQALAQAQADAAKLQADTLAQTYADARQGGSGQVQVVAPASYVGDNRRSMVQLAVAASVFLGLIVGVALATIVVNQAASRRRSASTS
jgi:hypothetical protein